MSAESRPPELPRPACRLAGHRGQGVRRPPAERPVLRPARRARPGRGHPAVLRRRPDPRRSPRSASGAPAVFLALFTLGSQDYQPAGRLPSWVWSRRCLVLPSPSMLSTASAPRARCRDCWPSRSTATTSSTASSRPGWPSSGSSSCRSSCSSPGSACFRLGIVPHGQEVLRLVAWVAVTFVYVGLWLAFGLLLSVAHPACRDGRADRVRRLVPAHDLRGPDHRPSSTGLLRRCRGCDAVEQYRPRADPAVHQPAAAEHALRRKSPRSSSIRRATRRSSAPATHRPGRSRPSSRSRRCSRSTRACCSSGRRSSRWSA